MRHYTYSDLHYREGIDNLVIDASANITTLELNKPSKALLVRNTGTKGVYLAFDKNTAGLQDFLLAPGDGLVELPVQCKTVSAVCAALESTTVRITSCY